MASAEHIPGDVITIDSSDEDPPPIKRKRLFGEHRSDGEARASAGGPPDSKRARLGPAARNSPDSHGSEEGEVEESEEQRDSSGGDKGEKAASTESVKQPVSSPWVIMPPDPPLWSSNSLDFKLPAFSSKRKGSWLERFKAWARAFCYNNLDYSAAITPALALAAYLHYLDQHSGLKAGKRKTGRQAAMRAEESGVLAKHLEMLRAAGADGCTEATPNASDSPTKEPSPQTGRNPDARLPKLTGEDKESNGTASERRKRVPTDGEELAQQRKYFPSATDPSSMCLLCARQGHAAASCPYSACRFCGGRGHWDFDCPTKALCANCRQFGHAADACTEKLKLTKDEGLACAFCNSTEHLEDECTEMWRSFHPEAETIQTVRQLPVSCAICGANSHFLSDCRQRVYPANPTWSLANRNRYMDPDCGTLSIEDAMGPGGATWLRAPELRIRGRAARATNVHYSESDDSDLEFLGSRLVKQGGKVGQARASSSMQMSIRAGAGAGDGQSQLPTRPPLPSGPPPWGAPRGQGRFNPPPHPPATSLPAKPAAPARGYHKVAPPPSLSGSRGQDASRGGHVRGGPGNHGGRGGRGRGRGRGRGGAR